MYAARKEEILEYFLDFVLNNDKTDWEDGCCPQEYDYDYNIGLKCNECNKIFSFNPNEEYIWDCSFLSDAMFHRKILRVLKKEGYID